MSTHARSFGRTPETPQEQLAATLKHHAVRAGRGHLLIPAGWKDSGGERYAASRLADYYGTDVRLAPRIEGEQTLVDAWIGPLEAAWEMKRVTEDATNPRGAFYARLRRGKGQAARISVTIVYEGMSATDVNRALGSAFARYSDRIERVVLIPKSTGEDLFEITPEEFRNGKRF